MKIDGWYVVSLTDVQIENRKALRKRRMGPFTRKVGEDHGEITALATEGITQCVKLLTHARFEEIRKRSKESGSGAEKETGDGRTVRCEDATVLIEGLKLDLGKKFVVLLNGA